MPTLIDYPQVLATLTQRGLVSLYHNSGAFGFASTSTTHSVGWILQDDPTLRPAARQIACVLPVDELSLAGKACEWWATHLPDDAVWLMPKSHWAYELDFGSHQWLAAALRRAGVDPDALAARHDGSAIAFAPADRPAFQSLLGELLQHLFGSDFQFVFEQSNTICTVHHHKQLWWTTQNPAVAERLREDLS